MAVHVPWVYNKEEPDATRTPCTGIEMDCRRARNSAALALRARIVLACAEGESNTAGSARMRLCKPAVGKWRGRFVANRLDGLLDEPRPGAPRRIGDARVERVLTVTLESMPSNTTHWSTRL